MEVRYNAFSDERQNIIFPVWYGQSHSKICIENKMVAQIKNLKLKLFREPTIWKPLRSSLLSEISDLWKCLPVGNQLLRATLSFWMKFFQMSSRKDWADERIISNTF